VTLELRALPDSRPPGCCEVAPSAGLGRPTNQPNLPEIAYRVGAFASFRDTMLDDLAVLLPGWREAPGGRDYATAIVELWAYVADILAFYQERIANEAFLRTATMGDSLQRLAELVGYRRSPGSGARALIAFELARDRAANLPAGLRVSSQPQGRQPAIFETESSIEARAEHNAIPMLSRAPVNQFAPLEALEAAGDARVADDLPAMTRVYGALAPILLNRPAPATPAPSPAQGALAAGDELGKLPDFAGAELRRVSFRGTGLRLTAGDLLLILEESYDAVRVQTGKLREVIDVTEDPSAKKTSVRWLEDPHATYATASPEVFAFRIKAGPFGQTAAAVDTYLPEDDSDVIDLDGEYPELRPSGPGSPSLVVLLDTESSPREYQLLAATRVDSTAISRTYTTRPAAQDERTRVQSLHTAAASKVDAATEPPPPLTPPAITFELTGKVSRVTLDRNIHTSGLPFSRRNTIVLARSEPLELANARPLPEAMSGSQLLLDGVFPDLTSGQQVVIRGKALGPDGAPADQTLVEDVRVTTVRVESGLGTTVVGVSPPLSNSYARSATELLGNVTAVTHGETVREEILGSGDGTAWQRYRLRKSPLTYLASAGDSDEPIESTLRVTVDGVAWLERPSFLAARPGERTFVTEQDERGDTVVVFGDGSARPPTGRDNVRAHYRRGLGSPGAVDADTITKLVDGVPGLKGVTNPEPSFGAADPETAEELRANAPANMRTFGCAVSVEDYATLACSYHGVEMARADWTHRAAGGLRSRPGIRLAVAGRDRTPLSTQALRQLRRFLDLRRDVNVPLRLVTFDPVYVDVSAIVDIDDRYGRAAVLRAALAALNPLRNPDGGLGYIGRLGFGESPHLSGVYAALQRVPGVTAVTVRTLRQPQTDPRGTVRDGVPVPPTGLAVILNEPTDRENRYGRLTILPGQGGYID
jgi:hypothetical protein